MRRGRGEGEERERGEPIIIKHGARYSQNTDKPTVWYLQSHPCICCLTMGFLEMGRNI